MRLSAISAAFAIALGCSSSSRPPPLGDDLSGGDAGFDFGFGPPAAPRCEVGIAGGVCACVDMAILTDVPNLYFVVDRSGSMNLANKWTTVRGVIGRTVRRLGPRVNVGAAVFPNKASSDCGPGGEVMGVRPGDSPAGAVGPTLSALGVAFSLPAAGGTPTSSTLYALRPKLTSLGGRTFVILATDGGPNCNAAATCNADKCIPNIEHVSNECVPGGKSCCTAESMGPANCLDEGATIDAVTLIKNAGIPVYVIGVPGSAPYAGLLDELALAGGTAREGTPRYYRVDSTDEEPLAAALAQVAAKVTATCTLPFAKDEKFDPDKVNVFLDDQVVPRDPVNGWTVDGTTVTLVGAACNRVLAGEVLGVRVVAGCPTVLK